MVSRSMSPHPAGCCSSRHTYNSETCSDQSKVPNPTKTGKVVWRQPPLPWCRVQCPLIPPGVALPDTRTILKHVRTNPRFLTRRKLERWCGDNPPYHGVAFNVPSSRRVLLFPTHVQF